MGLFGPPNIVRLEADRNIPALTKALAYPKDPSVRRAAADALGRIALQPKAGQGGPSAARALVETRDPEAVPALISLLQYRNWVVRKYAAEALGRIGDARAIPALAASFHDPTADVRQAIAEALHTLGWAPTPDEAGAAYWVARGALGAAGAIGVPAIPVLTTVLHDRYWFARLKAVEALGRIHDPQAILALTTALQDEVVQVRQAAVEGLRRSGDALAIPALTTALQDQESALREAAAQALDALGWRPSPDEMGATYWIAKDDSEKAAAIGAPAIPSLLCRDQRQEVGCAQGSRRGSRRHLPADWGQCPRSCSHHPRPENGHRRATSRRFRGCQ